VGDTSLRAPSALPRPRGVRTASKMNVSVKGTPPRLDRQRWRFGCEQIAQQNGLPITCTGKSMDCRAPFKTGAGKAESRAEPASQRSARVSDPAVSRAEPASV